MKGYLIPRLLNQPYVDEVFVWCDEEKKGNLYSCMDSFRHIPEDWHGATWHMQDDVIIARNFFERVTIAEKDEIVCGFCCPRFNSNLTRGYSDPEHMWYSFPCIRIPDDIARECGEWFFGKVYGSPVYRSLTMHGNRDDQVFKKFLEEEHPDIPIYHMKPCMVEHVDWLLGGSMANKDRKKIATAMWFEDGDLVNELERRINSEQRNHY